MRLFDTHCHFETCDASAIGAVMARAKAAGVERIMAVGGSPELNSAVAVAMGLGALGAMGLDRDQAAAQTGDSPRFLAAQTGDSPRFDALAAWGEIGLDYHYSPEIREKQLVLFENQLEEAKRRDLPVVIHTREADEDTLAVLKSSGNYGIIHSFTGTVPFARALLDLGYHISYSGIVTFKAAENVRESVPFVPGDRILIETDSPFLAPVPMRGKTNEPAFVKHTCEFLAKIRGMSAEDFAELTFTNAERLLIHKP